MPRKLTTRQEQAADSRKKLLASALQLFSSRGYHATPVRQINRNANMADGLLYHYFPGGKEEMLQVLVSEKFEDLVGELEVRHREIEHLPLGDVLEQTYQNWLMLFTKYQNILKIVFRENEAMQIIDRDKITAFMHRDDRWFPHYLSGLQQNGRLRDMEVNIAADCYRSMLIANFLTIVTGSGSGILTETEQRKKIINHYVTLWTNPQPSG